MQWSRRKIISSSHEDRFLRDECFSLNWKYFLTLPSPPPSSPSPSLISSLTVGGGGGGGAPV